jgi:hypothetical protein
MPRFQGQPVFRNQGSPKNAPLSEWEKTAHRGISQGGRLYKNKSTGDMHLVSPSGSHWGSFTSNPESYKGGNLNKYEPEENAEEITRDFKNGK